MKRFNLKFTLFTMTFLVLASCLLVRPQAVSAAEEEVAGGTLQTEGVITFVPGEDSTKPVDPENPDPEDPVLPIDPEDPTKPVTPGTKGPLTIDFASKFYFGVQKITSQDATYMVKAQLIKDADGSRYTNNYVQVTDNRGTLEGWTLSVKQEEQFKIGNRLPAVETPEGEATQDGTVLEGAQLVLNNGALSTISDSAKPAIVAPKTTLVPGEVHNLLVASEGAGAGTYVYRWGGTNNLEGDLNSSITLSVPGSTVKLSERYATILTWTLSSTPDNN